MCPSYSFLKSVSRIAVFQWFEKNKISANSCKDFSVKLVVKKSRKRMRLSAESGQFLSVAGSKQTLIITLMCFFFSKLFTRTKSSAEATIKGWINQGGST